MNPYLKIDMAAATRLTREGRLDEALAILRGKAPSAKPAVDRHIAEEAPNESQSGQTRPLIDMAPPSSAGGSWTSQFTASPPAPPAGGMSAQRPRQAHHGMISRLGKLGSGKLDPMHGLPGMRGSVAHRAPVALPEGAQFADRSYVNEAGQRDYKLYVPSTFKGEAAPLVVMLHGCTQSPVDFAAGTRMNELAEELTFFVAYPAQTQSANPSRCWNWFNAGDQQRDRGEPSLIAGITREIMSEYSVDPARVFIAGLSAGGAAAAVMGSLYPDLYAAIGVHSGLACGAARDMPSAFAAMRNGSSAPIPRAGRAVGGVHVPAIVFHGDSDRTVSPVNGAHVIDQARANADLRTSVHRGQAPGGTEFTCTIHIDSGGRGILEHWVLHGVGHAWSGGSAAGSYTDPLGPDASREMLRFFLQHHL